MIVSCECGAKLKVEEGQKVDAGQRLVEWDPYSTPLLTELGGKVVVPPFDAPWVRMTIISDPQGATFIASKFERLDRPEWTYEAHGFVAKALGAGLTLSTLLAGLNAETEAA